MNTPREVARKEVLSRVLTLEQAKEKYKDWIKEALALGGQSNEVIAFWEEVYREVDNVNPEPA